MASNNEDIAQDLANEITALKLELESLREEIMDRRERHQIKAIELERVKQIAANRLEELTRLKTRPIRDQEREYHAARMTFVGGRWVTTEAERGIDGEGGLWGAHCRGEI